MPKVDLYNLKGEKTGDCELSDAVFAVEISTAAMHQAVVTYNSNQRQGTQSTLTRSEVSGGGKKPWRQKGTGRARVGSSRNPVWTHGGVAFAPKPRDYSKKMNKKARRLALKSALTCKVNDGEIVVIENLELESLKTKNMVSVLKALGVEGKALVVTNGVNHNAVRATGNIPGVDTVVADSLNIYDVLAHDKFVVTKDAIARIEEVYA
jgi:large subunit ribosomal protein L4